MKRFGWLWIGWVVCLPCPAQNNSYPLWDRAQKNREVLKISTLFTAQNVRDYLAAEPGIQNAIDWCKQTGVTHVFIETFRDNYTAKRETLEKAKQMFRAAGFEVSGCVTTTRVGKLSTGWKVISCCTNQKTQEQLQEIFQYTASIFDEIMIDDFLFTDCQCEQCKQARGTQSWSDYRCDLMLRLSRKRILQPARKVNPRVKIIIKYPQWYDNFHQRGYEVIRQTAEYDKIWVGTETRDFQDKRWGGKVQYEAYYIMRWLGEIGRAKTGGGWFDPYGTTENTYLEQARQTVLAGAREMLLFCYGSLLRETGPANVKALRKEIPLLFQLAGLIRNQPIRGIPAPKPPNSDAYEEPYVYDFIGMLGLPLVPTTKIDAKAKSGAFAVHVLKDTDFPGKLKQMLAADKPVLMTDALAKRLQNIDLNRENLITLRVNGNPKNLLTLTRRDLQPIRDKLLAPWQIKFDAPNLTALYLFGDDLLVVENFHDEPIRAALEINRLTQAETVLVVPPDGKAILKRSQNKLLLDTISGRTLVAIRYQ